MAKTIEVPVLIVGGGGAGLTASMLFGTYGVESLLVSALPTTSVLPKAHVLNQRSMEVFRTVGVAEAIEARSTPAANMSHTAWYLDVSGEPDAGRLLHKMECWDGGGQDPAWLAASPCRQANLPQLRLEPVLRARAEELNPGRVCFGHELTALQQDATGVLATIHDRAAGDDYQVRARYVLGCDGGRTVGRQVGVELDGQRDLMRSVSVHLTADLSRWLRDEDVLIRWIVHTRYGGAFSALVAMGPERWGTRSEEWVFHMLYPPDAEPLFDTDEKAVGVMCERLGLPDFRPRVHLITRWRLEGLVAPRTRVGRVFLVGDAAHRHPPTGGLGLTSAVHDAYNLCWKVTQVLRGTAGESLLDTYHQERFPAFARNVQRSVENALNHLRIIGELGVEPTVPPHEARARVRRLWEEGPEAEAFRVHMGAVFNSQSMEFKEHNVEYGFRFDSTAIAPDGSPAPASLDDVRIYTPDTRPGSPLPHAWVERAGVTRALREVAPAGAFTLIAGEEGEAWCSAARDAASARGVELVAVKVGHAEGDWLDPRLAFVRIREFGRTGAILVRPDRVVAWRTMGAGADPVAELAAALDRVLGRAS